MSEAWRFHGHTPLPTTTTASTNPTDLDPRGIDTFAVVAAIARRDSETLRDKLRELAAEDAHPEDACRRCGGPNVPWAAASPLWNLVMREGSIDGPWKYDELICIGGFLALANEAGVDGIFRVSVRPDPPGLETVTPSGRVWNPVTWHWDTPRWWRRLRPPLPRGIAQLDDAITRLKELGP